MQAPILLFALTGAAQAEVSRTALLTAMSNGVDRCLEFLDTENYTALDGLEPPKFSENSRFRPKQAYALGDGGAFLWIAKNKGDHLLRCGVASRDRQGAVNRFALQNWARKTIAAIVSDKNAVEVTDDAMPGRASNYFWCDDADQLFQLNIGASQSALDVRVDIWKFDLNTQDKKDEARETCEGK